MCRTCIWSRPEMYEHILRKNRLFCAQYTRNVFDRNNFPVIYSAHQLSLIELYLVALTLLYLSTFIFS